MCTYKRHKSIDHYTIETHKTSTICLNAAIDDSFNTPTYEFKQKVDIKSFLLMSGNCQSKSLIMRKGHYSICEKMGVK